MKRRQRRIVMRSRDYLKESRRRMDRRDREEAMRSAGFDPSNLTDVRKWIELKRNERL